MDPLAREIVELRRMQRQLNRLDVGRGLMLALAGLINLTLGAWNIETALIDDDAVILVVGMVNLGAAIFAALIMRRLIIDGHGRRQMMRELEERLRP